MTPITPERFLELLKESNTEKVMLWDITANDYYYYSYIKKRADSSFIACKPESHNFCILNYLYESKPETPLEGLDELNEIINDLRKHFGTRYTCKWDAWRNKYESQLKELKS